MKKRTAILALLVLMLFVSSSTPVNSDSLDRSQIADLFSQAKDMFRQGDKLAATDPETAKDYYLKSAMRFERIIREGEIENGKLYYNIGNAYFRINDIGRAILNYRRAMQYIPNDPNLNQNLKYARAMRFDKIEEGQKTKVFKTLFFWHYDFSTKTRVVIFILCFALIWITAAVRLFLKRTYLNWACTLLTGLSLVFLVSLAFDVVSLRTTRPGVIIDVEVVARKGNSETYAPSFKDSLHSGTEFILLEDRGKWFQIQLPDSRSCWIPAKSVELIR